ncbi:MAG TPA: RHS repeat-associated core domain-containing protein, partial [Dongiaceae bacterium]|nr:RHS repeat-associated core domain-containing protein [Dongiaceae bacterium]
DPTTGQVTATSLGGVTDERQFDDRGLLTNYVASAKGTSIWSLTLSYDLIGRLTNKVESIGGSATTFGYTYDVAGRLAQASRNGAVSATYTYDLNGNRLTRNSDSATYDSQDRLQTYAGGTFSWSPNGNLQSVVSGGQTTTYSYDVRGALTGVALPGKPAISYLIDAAGRRIGKKLGAALQRGWLWDETLRDEDVPTAELDGNSAVTLRFVWASGANTPSYFDAGTNTYRVLSDERGSVRLVVSVADGSIAQRIDYDEFGQVLSDSAPGFQPFGFAGGLYDSDTGLVRLGARDYNAAIGRWTDRDPSAFDSGTFNLYAYCDNDPLNRVDIDGTSFVNNWVGDWADEYYAILNAGQDCFALRALVARLKKRENDIQGGDCKQNNENGYQQIHEALDRAESLALEKCTWAAVQIYKKGLGRVK